MAAKGPRFSSRPGIPGFLLLPQNSGFGCAKNAAAFYPKTRLYPFLSWGGVRAHYCPWNFFAKLSFGPTALSSAVYHISGVLWKFVARSFEAKFDLVFSYQPDHRILVFPLLVYCYEFIIMLSTKINV